MEIISIGLCITILLTLLLMPKTLAKYTTTEKIDNKLEIAQPIFQVKGTEIAKINSINIIFYKITVIFNCKTKTNLKNIVQR